MLAKNPFEFVLAECIVWMVWRSVNEYSIDATHTHAGVIWIRASYVCSGKRLETRRHYFKLMSFAIIINDTAVLKRKNNCSNTSVWGWVNFVGDLNLIWISFRWFFSWLLFSRSVFVPTVFFVSTFPHFSHCFFPVFKRSQCSETLFFPACQKIQFFIQKKKIGSAGVHLISRIIQIGNELMPYSNGISANLASVHLCHHHFVVKL